MDTAGTIVASLGLLVNFAATMWLAVCAFRKSLVWGLLFFVPFAGFIYIIMDWRIVSKPFLIAFGGLIMVCVGLLLSPTMQKIFTSSGSFN